LSGSALEKSKAQLSGTQRVIMSESWLGIWLVIV
jgi:hypothetical protein